MRKLCFLVKNTFGLIKVCTIYSNLPFSATGSFNPTQLYQVRLPIVDNDICEETYNDVDYRGTICAGSVENGGIGSCNVHSICLVFYFMYWN